MLAPIMGNNDVQMYPEGWLEQLRDFATQHNIVLIFDEVQTGSGRCGTPTYAQKCGVKPDIITLAKGIGMGCPVGVVLATEEVASAFTPGSHFSTFGGNPLSCVFINAMLDWLAEPANLRGVEEKGDAIRQRLQNLCWPKNIRGSGMLNAFDIDIDGIDYAMGCLDRGLLIGAFRKGAGAVKITPPLNISDEQLESGLDAMDFVYRKLKGKQ
jgi:acetylornithine/succinyldiaminopimelate/putrescine aminotransferase